MINFGIFFRISRNFDHSAITKWQLTQHRQKYQTTLLARVTLSMYVIELSSPISTKVVVLLHGSEEYDRYLGPTIVFAKWVKWWCRDMCCICCQEAQTGSHEQTCQALLVLDRELNLYHRGKITDGYVSILQTEQRQELVQNTASSLLRFVGYFYMRSFLRIPFWWASHKNSIPYKS